MASSAPFQRSQWLSPDKLDVFGNFGAMWSKLAALAKAAWNWKQMASVKESGARAWNRVKFPLVDLTCLCFWLPWSGVKSLLTRSRREWMRRKLKDAISMIKRKISGVTSAGTPAEDALAAGGNQTDADPTPDEADSTSLISIK